MYFILKNQVWKIKFEELDFNLQKSISISCNTGSNNPVWNILKIESVELDFSKIKYKWIRQMTKPELSKPIPPNKNRNKWVLLSHDDTKFFFLVFHEALYSNKYLISKKNITMHNFQETNNQKLFVLKIHTYRYRDILLLYLVLHSLAHVSYIVSWCVSVVSERVAYISWACCVSP